MAPQAGMQRRPSGRAGPVSTLLKGCSPPEQVTGPFAPARTGIIIHIGADRPRSGDSSSCSRGRFCRKGPCPNPAQKQVPPAPFHAISRVWGMPGSLSPKGEFTLVYPMLARLYPSAEMWPSGRRRSPAKAAHFLGKPLKYSGFFVAQIADSQILPIIAENPNHGPAGARRDPARHACGNTSPSRHQTIRRIRSTEPDL